MAFPGTSSETALTSSSAETSGSVAAAPGFVAHGVGGVAIKLPPYWAKDPDLWFSQVEAQFFLRNITVQLTKFNYVISALSPEIIVEVRDIVLHPPTIDPYKVLKAALILRTADSEQTRLQRLLDGEQLGDRTPSQLLRKMQQLLGESASIDTSILKSLFLRRLPKEVNMVLVSASSSLDIDNLAAMADKIMEVSRPQNYISAISPSAFSSATTLSSQPPHVNVDNPLQEEVRQLREMVQQLSLQMAQNHRSRSNQRNTGRNPVRNRSRSASRQPNDSTCWYHQTFGDKARKCTCSPPQNLNVNASR